MPARDKGHVVARPCGPPWRLHGNLAIFLGVITVATGIVCLLSLRGFGWGVKNEWEWHRGGEFLKGMWGLPLIPLAVALAGLPILLRWHRARRPGRLDTVVTVIFLIAITFALQMAVWFMQPGAVGAAAGVMLSPTTTTYFTYAFRHRADSLSFLLSNYAQIMREFRAHARTHPPGPLILFWATQRVVAAWPGLQRAIAGVADAFQPGGFDFIVTVARGHYAPLPRDTVAAAILAGFLLPFLGSLSVVFVYFLARLLNADQVVAVVAGFCAATIPSLVLFAPAVDQVAAFLGAAALLALCAAGMRGSLLLAAVAGVILALGTFVSLAILALAPLGGLWLALSRPGPRLRVALAWAGGFIAFFLVLFGLFRFNFIAVVLQGIGAHHAYTTQAFPRTYHKWLFWNLMDAALFLGVPLALWLGRQAIGQARRAIAVDPLLLAWLITVLALDLSGVVRGEAGRLWMFLLLPAAVPAGAAIARLGPTAGRATAVTLVLQVAQVIVFKEMMSLFVI